MAWNAARNQIASRDPIADRRIHSVQPEQDPFRDSENSLERSLLNLGSLIKGFPKSRPDDPD